MSARPGLVKRSRLPYRMHWFGSVSMNAFIIAERPGCTGFFLTSICRTTYTSSSRPRFRLDKKAVVGHQLKMPGRGVVYIVAKHFFLRKGLLPANRGETAPCFD